MSEANPGVFHRVGAHSIELDPPDVCVVRVDGPLSPGEALELITTANGLAEARTHLFLLADLSRATSLPPESRKVLAATPRSPKHRGVAVIETSFHIRALIMLVAKARDILNRQKDNPLRVFSGADDARAWLAERRRAVAGSRA
jgi:hypothetical protein